MPGQLIFQTTVTFSFLINIYESKRHKIKSSTSKVHDDFTTSIYYHVPLYPVPVLEHDIYIYKKINKSKVIMCAGSSVVLEVASAEV